MLLPVVLAGRGLVGAGGPGGKAGSAATGCSASYATQSQWSGGLVAGVTVTNTGTSALTAWTVTFTFGGDQKVTNAWGASLTQSIEYVTATNASYDGSVAVGASTSFGFQGTWRTSDAVPASLTCTPGRSVTPAVFTN